MSDAEKNKVYIALYVDKTGNRFWEQYYGRNDEYQEEVRLHKSQKTICMGVFEVTEVTTFQAPNKMPIAPHPEVT